MFLRKLACQNPYKSDLQPPKTTCGPGAGTNMYQSSVATRKEVLPGTHFGGLSQGPQRTVDQRDLLRGVNQEFPNWLIKNSLSTKWCKDSGLVLTLSQQNQELFSFPSSHLSTQRVFLFSLQGMLFLSNHCILVMSMNNLSLGLQGARPMRHLLRIQ